MKDIAIIGAGGLGREALVLIQQINEVRSAWNVIGFYDDDTSLHGQRIAGVTCLGPVELLQYFPDELYLVLAIGSPTAKARLAAQLQNPVLRFATLVHPLSAPRPYQHIELSEGVLVFQGAALTTNIRLGSHTLVYLNCTIGHDAAIGNFCSLMPGAGVSGNTTLGDRVLIGANATILQGLHIGNDTQIGAGAVVTASVPSHSTAVGVPAKIIK